MLHKVEVSAMQKFGLLECKERFYWQSLNIWQFFSCLGMTLRDHFVPKWEDTSNTLITPHFYLALFSSLFSILSTGSRNKHDYLLLQFRMLKTTCVFLNISYYLVTDPLVFWCLPSSNDFMFKWVLTPRFQDCPTSSTNLVSIMTWKWGKKFLVILQFYHKL